MSTKFLTTHGLSGHEPAERISFNKAELILNANRHAILQLGAIATGIRNSIGGSTYSQNKGGAYVKAKPIPTNPRTSYQQAVRQNFSINAKVWSGTLDDSQRAAWTFFAQNNPYTNVFGQAKILSGLAMMMKLNQVLSQTGSANITDPPSDLNVPAIAAATGLTKTVVGGNLTVLTVTTDAQAAAADTNYYVFATAPLAAGKAAAVNDFRWIDDVQPTAAATSFNIFGTYSNRFGTAAAAGRHIAVLIAQWNVTSGAVAPGLIFDTGPL